MTFGVAINPGTGPVGSATADHAAVNIQQFVADLAARNLHVVETRRNLNDDYDREDNDGRFAFDLVFDDGRIVQIQMPGLPVERVRWLGSDQDIWQFPRLYVDDASWVWFFALNVCHSSGYEPLMPTNPSTVAGEPQVRTVSNG